MLIAILPVFILIALGYALRRLNVIKSNWINILNSFVFYISLPALIISNLSEVSKELLSPLLSIVTYNFAIVLISAVVLLLLLTFIPISKKLKAAVFISTIMGNTVYLGIPLVQNILSPSASEALVGIISIAGVTQLITGMLLALIALEFVYGKTRNWKVVAMHLIKNPLVISAIVGLGLSFISLPTMYTQILQNPISMLAATASPLALITIGGFLYGHKKFIYKELAALASTLKLIGMPLLAWVIYQSFNLPKVTGSSAILMSAMPVAVTAFIIAEKYELDSRFVAIVMLVTTITSFATINLIASSAF